MARDCAIQTIKATAAVAMPLLAAADLQDNLLMVGNDLERLQTLLDDACAVLLAGFYGVTAQLRGIEAAAAPDAAALARAGEHLASAATALQFHDMASQLIAHTQQRLRHCTDRLARETFADDDEDGDSVVEDLPLRPNPVTQDEMDAGSIDLF